MKAVVMAGGEGTRLRPISQNIPKPMVPMLDKPVLRYILELLKKSGVTEACLTLNFLPGVITDYVGDGSEFGMKLHAVVEHEALGTAGSVKNCADILGDEDFIVISGDCVCDFDLAALVDFHKYNNADVTLALYSHPEPLEYGLVITDGDGRIMKFVEKPAWEGVVTDKINTGIYVISPSVLRAIPDGRPCDFGRELFPRLLMEECKLYGFTPGGYWRDIGSPEAYLACCMDILDRKVILSADMASRTPNGVTVTPPVYIGANVSIAPGAQIGPRAVIGAGSVIEAGARVTDSVVNGATLRESATLEGAVICRRAEIGRTSEALEGSVVGEGCAIGDGCLIAQGVGVWPGRRIPNGTRVTESITRGMMRAAPGFTSGGVIEGVPGDEITPAFCLTLGAAAAVFGRVGLGYVGDDTARVLFEAFGSGVCASGGELLRYDCGAVSCASFVGMCYSLPVTVNITQAERNVRLTFFGDNGGLLTHDDERRILSGVREGVCMNAGVGAAHDVSGVFEAYAAAAARYAAERGGGGIPVRVTGGGAANRALKKALSMLGCTFDERSTGLPRLEASPDGLRLAAYDEEGRAVDSERLLLLVAEIEMNCGRRELSVHQTAPAALDGLAARYGADILRIGRDGERAAKLYTELISMRDAVFAGTLICAWLSKNNISLCDAMASIPRFSSVTRELTLNGERGAVMGAFAESAGADVSSGVRLSAPSGVVYITPLRSRRALLIRSEGASEEIAEELCAEFERRAKEIDRG